MRTVFLTMLGLFCVHVAAAQDVGNQPAALSQTPETMVYPVRSGSAMELASALEGLFPGQKVTARPEQNVLLIRATTETRDAMLKSLSQLDRPQGSIMIHAYLLRSHGRPLEAGETAMLTGPRDEVLRYIEMLRKSDQLSIENRIELSTIENQKAQVQIGHQVSVVVGTTLNSSRGRTNSYQRMETGTIFAAAARTTPDQAIVMEITFEKSELDRPTQATADDPAPPALISNLTYQGTVQFAEGEAMLAGTLIGKANATSGHSYLVVTATTRLGKRPHANGRETQAGRAAEDPQAAVRAAVASRPARSTESSAGNSLSDRYLAYAQRVVERYDVDGDQRLNAEERAKMTKDASAADADGDGLVAAEELARYYQSK